MATSIFYDGERAVAHQVEAALEGESLVVRALSGETLADWPIASMSRLTSREAAGEYCLTRGGLARLILRDAAVQNQLAAHHTQIARPLTGWRKEFRILAICAFAAFALGMFLWQGVPLLAKPITAMIPKTWEYEIGLAVYNTFLEQADGKVCHTRAGDEALARLTSRIFAGEDLNLLPEAEPKIVILDADQQNALAFPGGFIVIFRGLLDEASDPDLLAGVLAHEISHIAERHGLQRVVGSSAIWFFYSVLTSDIFSVPVFAALMLADNAYTRGMEYQADVAGRDLMRRKNINSAPLADWLERQSKKESPFVYLMTHPASRDRAAFFQTETGQKTKPSLSPKEWRALKNICKGA